MKQIAVTAEFHFKADQIDTGLNILKSIIITSRREKGCLQYELFQSGDNENIYIMVEKWKSRQDWQNHVNSDHIQAAANGIKALLETDLKINAYNFVM